MKIKISRTIGLILGIGIFVVAFISLFIIYNGRANEFNQVNDNIVQANSDLSKISSERNDWESQLAVLNTQIAQSQSDLVKAVAELASAGASLSNPVQSIEYDEMLVQIATVNALKVMALNFSEPYDVKLQDMNFSITTVTANFKGTLANILDLIDRVTAEKSFFANTTIKTVTIQLPEPLTDDEKAGLTEAEIAEKEMAVAYIELAIYTSKGE